MPASPATAPSRRAPSALPSLRAFLDESGYGEARAPADAGRRLDAHLRAADARRPDLGADERAAAARTVRRCATASPTAPSPTSPRMLSPTSRSRPGCASATSRRRRSCTPISKPGSSSWRISARSASSPAIRRRRSRSATRPPSICWCRCIAADCRNGCRCAPHREYRLPRYDMDAFLIEAELLLDWYLMSAGGAPAASVRREFIALVARSARAGGRTRPVTWVLRDYHSPNLLWLAERERHGPDRACSISRTR